VDTLELELECFSLFPVLSLFVEAAAGDDDAAGVFKLQNAHFSRIKRTLRVS
jgi:hypothetical protein